MVYLPTKKVSGKHYKVYKEPLKKGKKIPSKAELLRRALKRVSKLEDHEEWIDLYLQDTRASFTVGWIKEFILRLMWLKK